MKLHQKMDNLLAHWQLMHCAADTKFIMNLCQTHSDKIGICMNLLDPRRSWKNVSGYWESYALMHSKLWHGQLPAVSVLLLCIHWRLWSNFSHLCLRSHEELHPVLALSICGDCGKRLGTMIVNLVIWQVSTRPTLIDLHTVCACMRPLPPSC